jgi:hypothetical protein
VERGAKFVVERVTSAGNDCRAGGIMLGLGHNALPVMLAVAGYAIAPHGGRHCLGE